MGNNLNSYAKSYIQEQVQEQWSLFGTQHFTTPDAPAGDLSDQQRFSHGSSRKSKGSTFGSTGSSVYALNGDYSCCDRDRGCMRRACTGPVSYLGDPTVLMSMGLWTLRLGFPLLGWFFFVAIGKFTAGVGSAFLVFYLISRIDFTQGKARHSPEGREADVYQCPDWLSSRRINFAVAGSGGVGKSTLINTLRGLKAKDPLAAKVGAKETTMEAMDYRFPSATQPFASLTNLDKVSLWDLPGVGTEAFPAETYVRQMGLRYFDGVLIVTAERFTQNDIMLMNALKEFDVPFYMVRNKSDQALEMEFQEYGRAEGAVLTELREYYKEQNVASRLYFISAAKVENNRLDFDELLFQIASDLSTHRKLL